MERQGGKAKAYGVRVLQSILPETQHYPGIASLDKETDRVRRIEGQRSRVLQNRSWKILGHRCLITVAFESHEALLNEI